MVVESVLARPSRLLGGRGRTSARSGSVSKPPGARRGGILARPGPPGITGLAGPSSSPRVGRLPRSWSVPVMARPSPQSFFARSRPARSPSLGSTTTPDSRPGLVGVSEIVSTFQRRRRTRAPSIRHALATADLRHRPNPKTPMIRRGAHFRAVVGAEPVGTRASEHSSPPCRKANGFWDDLVNRVSPSSAIANVPQGDRRAGRPRAGSQAGGRASIKFGPTPCAPRARRGCPGQCRN
jgi:hypothetical protein